MKNSFISSLLFLTLGTGLTGIANGAPPETGFQHDRDAFQTILNSIQIIEVLQFKGRLISITMDSYEKDIYILRTQKCVLPVRFTRDCVFEKNLPVCKGSVEILAKRASGFCNP